MLTLSVVITAQNRPAYLKECVESLKKQSLDPAQFEIIIVDDDSKDPRALAAVRECVENKGGHQILGFYLQKSRGPGGARNCGNGHAAGDIIVVQDSDDISLEHRLLKIKNWFNMNIWADVFYSGAYLVDESLKTCAQHRATLEQFAHLERHQDIWHPTMAYRRRVLDQVSYPEDPADVDYGFLLAAKKAGCQFGFIDEPLVLYRSHPGQISRAQFAQQQVLAAAKKGRR